MNYNPHVSVLIGQTLTECFEIHNNGDEIIFKTEDKSYKLYHDQDCCESVYVESIVGDLKDLIGSPILIAEEVSNDPYEYRPEYAESYTWTFYKFSTIKGSVTIRFLGESNGYYSESVSFTEI